MLYLALRDAMKNKFVIPDADRGSHRFLYNHHNGSTGNIKVVHRRIRKDSRSASGMTIDTVIRAFSCVVLFLGMSFNAAERITHFHSAITVHQDSSMSVTETIQVVSTGRQIKRGIVREFPTRYANRFGTNSTVNFSIQEILHNGKPAGYHTQRISNGICVYIGEQDTFLSPGEHTYAITYTTNRQLGYYTQHDELFWNVTGNGWRLPIERATFSVTLPPNSAPQDVRTAAYTGYQDEVGHNFSMQVLSDGTICGATTRLLAPHEGLSIVVGWPKGIVNQPTFLQDLWYMIVDNLLLIIMLFILMAVLVVYVLIWVKDTIRQQQEVIIPLFHPPHGKSVADIACVDAMNYTHRALSASLMNLAVRGFITVDYNQNSRAYVLNKACATIPVSESTIERWLFGRCFAQGFQKTEDGKEETTSTNRCVLNDQNPSFTESMGKFVEMQKRALDHYIDTRSEFIGGMVVITVVASIGVFFANSFSNAFSGMLHEGIFYALVGCLLLAHWWGSWLIRCYTPEGRVLKNQIDGFKMFLSTTHTEQLKVAGAPPTKTPQLYEKYLPYAMALGVEEQWTQQFDAVFAGLKASGHEYRPAWGYYGAFRHGHRLYPHFSSVPVVRSPKAISSSGFKPGSRSGFGGGGGAGRGGGGGGGGGW